LRPALLRRLPLLLLPFVGAGCAWAERRALDLGDCFRAVVGGGLGLSIDAQATDYVSPGIGVASYTRNFGWFDREVHGAWLESDVINTPRLAYEGLADEFAQAGREQLDEQGFVARLALSSLNLPNERWIRSGGVVRVEHFALFNFFGVGSKQRAWWLADLLVEPGDSVTTPSKSVWQAGFVEVGATAVIVHARVGVNLLEFVDLVCGLVGLDPAGDDEREPFYELMPLDDGRGPERRFWEL
jgi:hypothetical protein